MRITLLILLTCIVAFMGGCSFNRRSPSEVLLAVPDGYRGELTIKQDAQKGKQPEVRALENFGDYVYEFPEIENRIVYVREISLIINANEISVSAMSVAPLKSRLVRKNEKDNVVVIEILHVE